MKFIVWLNYPNSEPEFVIIIGDDVFSALLQIDKKGEHKDSLLEIKYDVWQHKLGLIFSEKVNPDTIIEFVEEFVAKNE